jgi:hypothetical protein
MVGVFINISSCGICRRVESASNSADVALILRGDVLLRYGVAYLHACHQRDQHEKQYRYLLVSHRYLFFEEQYKQNDSDGQQYYDHCYDRVVEVVRMVDKILVTVKIQLYTTRVL